MVKKVELKKDERLSDFLLDIIEKRENMSTRVYFCQEIEEELKSQWKAYGSCNDPTFGQKMYSVDSKMGLVSIYFWYDQKVTKFETRNTRIKTTFYVVSAIQLDGKCHQFCSPCSRAEKKLLIRRK